MSGFELQWHPAYRGISFIPTHDPHFCKLMLIYIGDIQHFCDREQPGSAQRLYSLFRLNTRNVVYRQGLGDVPRLNVWNARTEMASKPVRAWSEFALDANMDDPRNFLVRIARRSSKDYSKGMLAATKKFLQFVQFIWLEQVDPTFEFRPDYFFKNVDESDAWRQHVQDMVAGSPWTTKYGPVC